MSAAVPGGISYRPAGPAEAATVVALLVELVAELGPVEAAVRERLAPDIEAALAVPHVHVVLAWADDEAIGLCRGDVLHDDPIFRLRSDRRCGYIDQMYVRPRYRGQAVGAALLARLEAWFAGQGIAFCLLHAAPRAARFYARSGYQPNREMVKRLPRPGG